MISEDTICAIASGVGGAVSVIRVSGPDAERLCAPLWRSVSGHRLPELPPRVLTLGETEGSATMIDGVPVAPARADIEGYYNLNGTRMSLRTAQRGIYLVKYKDGSFQKIIVK